MFIINPYRYGISTYRYFRLTTTAVDGGDRTAIGELQILTEDGTAYPTSNMSSNSAPSPLVASASTEASGSEAAWYAFDGTEGGSNGWMTSSGNTTGWIKIDLGSGNGIEFDSAKITSIATAVGPVNRSPKDFVIEGSNDDSAWTNVLTISGSTGWVANQMRSFSSASAVAYRFLRINVTANNGSVGRSIFELEYLVDSTAYPTSNMTGASAPSPLVASASSDDGSNAAWEAFDGAVSGPSRWSTSDGASFPIWLQIDLGDGNEIIPTGLKLYNHNAAQQMPKTFTILGSNTGDFSGEQATLATLNEVIFDTDPQTETVTF